MAKETLYEILDVSPSATQSQIKEAYQRKAKIFHPDQFTGNEYMFKLVNEAYHTLKDENKRRQYDASLRGQTKQSTVDVASAKKQIVNELGILDYYNALNVARTAETAAIAEAYKKVLEAYKNGAFGPKTEQRAVSILTSAQEAYRILGNPTERDNYNKQWDATYGAILTGRTLDMRALQGSSSLAKVEQSIEKAQPKTQAMTRPAQKTNPSTQMARPAQKTNSTTQMTKQSTQMNVQTKKNTGMRPSTPTGLHTTKPIDYPATHQIEVEELRETDGKVHYKNRKILPVYINATLLKADLLGEYVKGIDKGIPVKDLYGIFGKDYSFHFAIEKYSILGDYYWLEGINGTQLSSSVSYRNCIWRYTGTPFRLRGQEVITVPAEMLLPMEEIRNNFFTDTISTSYLISAQRTISGAILSKPEILEAYFSYDPNEKGIRM